jgi:hypothetical protein
MQIQYIFITLWNEIGLIYCEYHIQYKLCNTYIALYKHYQKDRKMTHSEYIVRSFNPLTLKQEIKDFGIRYAYWKLRNLGGSRYETFRAILLSI